MAKVQKPKGNVQNLRVQFTDPESTTPPLGDDGKALIDPTTVQIVVRSPTGTVTTKVYSTHPEVIKESQGKYLYRLTLSEEGTYNWRWEATIPNGAVVVPGSLDSVREVDF